MSIGAKIRTELAKDLAALQEQILEEFRMRTPGYGGAHVTLDIPAHTHPLPGTEAAERGVGDTTGYTAPGLVGAWRFETSPGGMKSVGAVVNTAPYVEHIEYGWLSKKNIFVPGHHMASSAVNLGNVRNIYAQAARKALVVSLASGSFQKSLGTVKKGRRALGKVSGRKDGVYFYAKKGRITVQGAVGRGVSTETYKRMVENVADMVVAAING